MNGPEQDPMPELTEWYERYTPSTDYPAAYDDLREMVPAIIGAFHASSLEEARRCMADNVAGDAGPLYDAMTYRTLIVLLEEHVAEMETLRATEYFRHLRDDNSYPVYAAVDEHYARECEDRALRARLRAAEVGDDNNQAGREWANDNLYALELVGGMPRSDGSG